MFSSDDLTPDELARDRDECARLLQRVRDLARNFTRNHDPISPPPDHPYAPHPAMFSPDA